MKDKVEQQEKELNASNPQVFMEAQSATKEEVQLYIIKIYSVNEAGYAIRSVDWMDWLIVVFCLCPVIQILKMRNDARRLRSACEKMATREWKEGKNQLNKKMVSKLKVSCFNFKKMLDQETETALRCIMFSLYLWLLSLHKLLKALTV